MEIGGGGGRGREGEEGRVRKSVGMWGCVGACRERGRGLGEGCG